jgi:Tfp pilus assembly protein PilF
MKAARSFWIMSNNNLDQEYIYNHYELIGLVYELMAVGNIDLALEVLDLNLQAFPRSVDTHTYLAKLYIQKKQFSKARTLLEKALAIEPQNNEVLYLVEELQKVF